MPLPASRPLRIALGVLLVMGGFLGFLPILGFWMIPLGVMVLSVDILFARRLQSRVARLWQSWKQKEPEPISVKHCVTRHKKEGPDLHPAPKALGNGGVSSREDKRILPP